MEVWSIFKCIVILRKRGNLISVPLEMHVIYFSISEAYIDNSKSKKILWAIDSGFSCLQLSSSPVQDETDVRQSCVVCTLYVLPFVKK